MGMPVGVAKGALVVPHPAMTRMTKKLMRVTMIVLTKVEPPCGVGLRHLLRSPTPTIEPTRGHEACPLPRFDGSKGKSER